jgi:hypothetical protein
MTIIAPILRVSRGLLNNSAPSLLQLILRRMWQRPFVLEDLAEIAAVDPAAARWASDEIVRRQLSLDRPGGLNKGEFLAHRNVHRSEDETANPSIEGTS